MLEFRVLGPLEVVSGGETVSLGGPRQRAVLAILLLNANRVVSVERLADDLYAGEPPVTAVTQVQRQVSDLRKLLGPAAIETRAPGYVIHVEPGAFDLDRFERLTADAARSLEQVDPATSARLYQEALAVWRGAPLADLAYESFAQMLIVRLEELRLAAVEQRVAAELQLGHHVQLLPELETLVWDHPLRERLRGHLMLALYRSGRQAEALAVYRRARETLVDEFGIEPSASLRELERLILTQDPTLELAVEAARQDEERIVLVVPTSDGALPDLLVLAEPLSTLPGSVLLVARVVEDEPAMAAASAALDDAVSQLSVPARRAVFTSVEPARDVIRLATNYDAALIVLDDRAPDLAAVTQHSPSDVAVLHGPLVDWARGSGIVVPFGGSGHDWAALELAAWLAATTELALRLIGTRADPGRGLRDASRLLADASLAIQRVVGVAAESSLVDPSADALRAACAGATVVVTGLPSRWRLEGLDESRRALLSSGRPALLVHRGSRPSGLAPRESRTRFSWSLEP